MNSVGKKVKLVFTGTVGVLVGSLAIVGANQAIQAIQNDQIKVSLNGEIQVFKDENTGETQYPITYHDRTYLPLRNIAKLSGLDVDYDEKSKTAILIGNDGLTNYKSFDEIIEKTKNKNMTESVNYGKYLEVNYREICEDMDSGNLYYTYMDLNGDGKNELVIYSTSYEDQMIYGVFTEYENKIYESVVGWARNSFKLRENNIFENVGSSGASYTTYRLGMIEGHSLNDIFKIDLNPESSKILVNAQKEYDNIVKKYPLIKLNGNIIESGASNNNLSKTDEEALNEFKSKVKVVENKKEFQDDKGELLYYIQKDYLETTSNEEGIKKIVDMYKKEEIQPFDFEVERVYPQDIYYDKLTHKISSVHNGIVNISTHFEDWVGQPHPQWQDYSVNYVISTGEPYEFPDSIKKEIYEKATDEMMKIAKNAEYEGIILYDPSGDALQGCVEYDPETNKNVLVNEAGLRRGIYNIIKGSSYEITDDKITFSIISQYNISTWASKELYSTVVIDNVWGL